MNTVRRHGLTMVALGALAAWFALLRPVSLGGPVSYVMVRGTSMLPTYRAGGLVLLKQATSYRPGKVIAYRVPAGGVGAGKIVIHRIVGGDGRHGFRMRGDNNTAPDPWLPRSTDVVGTPLLYLPGAGDIAARLHQPVLAGGLAAGLAVTLVLLAPPRKREERALT